MFEQKAETIKQENQMINDMKLAGLKKDQQQRALRFTDMQQVVNARLMASQSSVDNAQNYPSTWTTNPDGGANGQV